MIYVSNTFVLTRNIVFIICIFSCNKSSIIKTKMLASEENFCIKDSHLTDLYQTAQSLNEQIKNDKQFIKERKKSIIEATNQLNLLNDFIDSDNSNYEALSNKYCYNERTFCFGKIFSLYDNLCRYLFCSLCEKNKIKNNSNLCEIEKYIKKQRQNDIICVNCVHVTLSIPVSVISVMLPLLSGAKISDTKVWIFPSIITGYSILSMSCLARSYFFPSQEKPVFNRFTQSQELYVENIDDTSV